MCGIVGILVNPLTHPPSRLTAVADMATTLRQRGPDGEGVWMDEASGMALAHRLLAIIDLSDAGAQPMQSNSGFLVMTFNGEVYNFAELRAELEALGHRFCGHSDTEIMLGAFESFGIEPALKRFTGMFALGVWDRKRRVLHLARDRTGKKPLYIAVGKGFLLFASELKAFRSFPGFSPTINRAAVECFLSRGWIPEHECIWEGVFKLPPASLVTVQMSDLNGDAEALQNRANAYWSLADVAEAEKAHPLPLSGEDLECELEHLLKTVVRERMIADVPIGAFLSGGIDSSVVVALMQAQSTRPIKTFTTGFAEDGFDEARHAGRVARHFGTDHTEFGVTPKEALDVFPELPRVWDEPFADKSQVPTLLLSRLARRQVTVVLSGDGGDEYFGGYTRHVWSSQLSPILRVPIGLRRGAGAALLAVTSYLGKRNRGARHSSALHPLINGKNTQRVARLLDVSSESELYERLTSFAPATSAFQPKNGYRRELPELGDTLSKFIYRDMTGYLPSDILVKLDRATMATALEGRCPLLDHRLVEFSWRIPTIEKVQGRKGKWILRKVLRRHLPKALFERPKQGFNLPINSWLVGPLRDWAQDMLSPARLARSGLQVPQHVGARWREHLSGARDRSPELWAMLMLEAWFEEYHSWTTPRPPREASAGVLDRHGSQWICVSSRAGNLNYKKASIYGIQKKIERCIGQITYQAFQDLRKCSSPNLSMNAGADGGCREISHECYRARKGSSGTEARDCNTQNIGGGAYPLRPARDIILLLEKQLANPIRFVWR